MIQKPETRADRLNRLCLQARWASPITLEDRARLEREAHLGNLPKGKKTIGYFDRDRGTPHGAAPPTPPGIRVTYHGGSIGLNLGGDMESGKTEGVEVMVAQGLLDRRVS